MSIKHFALSLGLLLCVSAIHAQVEESLEQDGEEREKPRFADRLVFGGDIGLSFGSITYIKLEPIVGYRITNRLTAGLGPIYIYENYKNYDLETSTFGGKVLASFTIFRGAESGGSLGIGNILLHAENEILSVEPLYLQNQGGYLTYYFGGRKVIDNLLLGGGLSQPISGKFSISLFILFDVTQNPYSPYSNPIFKVGFNF